MTDTNYLMQYFLEHSPKDSKPELKAVQTAKNTGKQKTTDDNKDKRDHLGQ